MITLEEAVKIANRAYNKGFEDAGGEVEDESVPDGGSWEYQQLLKIIREMTAGE
jgi:hypothetical protein